MKEFNLSQKTYTPMNINGATDFGKGLMLNVKDVKQFILLLKEEINKDIYSYAGKQKAIGKKQVIHIIDKFTGKIK